MLPKRHHLDSFKARFSKEVTLEFTIIHILVYLKLGFLQNTVSISYAFLYDIHRRVKRGRGRIPHIIYLHLIYFEVFVPYVRVHLFR